MDLMDGWMDGWMVEGTNTDRLVGREGEIRMKRGARLVVELT
jgi:hypothetical protein